MFEIPVEIPVEKKIKKNKSKKANVFDLLKAITKDKNLKEIDYNPSDCYFLLTLMCYNNSLNKYVEPFINFYGKISNKKILETMEEIIPKKSFFCDRKKKKFHNSKLVERVSDFFQVSDEVASDYLDTCEILGVYDEFIEHFELGGRK